MKSKRYKVINFVLLLVFMLGQFLVWVSVFQNFKKQPSEFSQKDLVLRKVSQKSHQIYCLGNWQAQFRANPLPAQNQHPVLGFQQEPHLLFMHRFDISFAFQTYSPFHLIFSSSA